MELAQEEFTMGSNDLTHVIKGKRTKRQRSPSPAAGRGFSSSSSSSGCGGEGEEEGEGEGNIVVGDEYGSISSRTTSCSEVSESTEEEEDMANCLILLAQGDGPKMKKNNGKLSSKKSSPQVSGSNNKAGFYVYECKTCNRSFPSFQALGGHRASHKKPKLEDKKPSPPATMADDGDNSNHHLGNNHLDDDNYYQLNKSSTSSVDEDHHHHHHHHQHIIPLSLQISTTNKAGFLANNKAKMHECSICGSEFTSGQALGGHMRRHRANTITNNQAGISSTNNNLNGCSDDQIKPRAILSLDLNLPAPEDDQHHHESKFQFVSTQQRALIFSSSPALVDCHY